MSHAPMHDLALVAPWWQWPDPRDSRVGRLTVPVLQKYESPSLVNDFLANPQRRLDWGPEDLVYRTEARFDVELGAGGRPRRLVGSEVDPSDGKRKPVRYVRSLRDGNLRKLFLDTHKRFYLVVCQIHCDRPGFPRTAREGLCSVGFAVRRRTTRVPAEGVREAAGILGDISTQRVRLEKIAGLVPGLRMEAAARRAVPGAPVLEDAKVEALVRQRGFVNELLDAERARLVEWADRFGVVPSLQGWFPSAFDKVGEWRDVAETPQSIDEEGTFPMYPLVPPGGSPEHAGHFGSIWFGLVPTGSADHEPGGRARFDDHTYYEIRCFAQRHGKPHDRNEPCRCPGRVYWSRATAPYWLASHYDVVGTSQNPVTVQLPDLRDLAAQGSAVPGATFVKPPGSMAFSVDGSGKAANPSSTEGFQICTLPIPLITIVAMFLLELTLPIVTFVFGLFWMLALKFCIPPKIEVAAGVTGELALDASFALEASIAASVNASIEANFGPASPGNLSDVLQKTVSPIAIANMEVNARALGEPGKAPSVTQSLDWAPEVPHP